MRDDIEQNRFVTDNTIGLNYPLDWFRSSGGAIKGDVNGNGIVDLSDAITVARILSGNDLPWDSIRLTADVNSNGKIDIAEMIYVLRKIADVGPELPESIPVADAGADQKVMIGSNWLPVKGNW